MKQTMCEKCRENPATVYYKENVNGKVREMHLCAACAKKEGVGEAFETPFFHHAVFSPFSLFADPFFSALPQRETSACPTCHTTQDQIRQSGRFGCPSCYDYFADLFDLAPFIGTGFAGRRLSDSPAEAEEDKPVEKAAAEPKEEASVKDKIATRRALLKKAIKEENYERAAELRDEIRALEGK